MAGVASRPFCLVQFLVGLAAVAVLLSTPAVQPAQADEVSSPLLAVVSLSAQRIKVYDSTGVVAESRVSTGMRGHRTPTGVFSILQRRRYHRSNIYSNAPMPYMQRLTWSGIALHAGHVPHYPASHGCIRLPFRFAPKLWKMTSVGTPVVVAPDDTPAVPIAHARLPEPRLTPATPDDLRRIGDAEADVSGPALALAETRVTDAAPDPGLAGVRLLNPLQRARAYKARVTAEVAATKKAARRARETAEARAADADRAAEARRRAERALARARREHEEAAAAAEASALERTSALQRARAELAAAEPALAAARMAAGEARLLAVVRNDEAAARTEPAKARRAAAARRRAEQALRAARRRHRKATEALERRALELANALKRASADRIATEAALAAARMTADEARLIETVQRDQAARATAARVAAEHAHRAALDAHSATRRIERPISIFVSREDGRVYVRHAWKAIHEAPVTFADGPPLGTHLYLAMAPAADGESMNWVSVSLPDRAPSRSRRRGRTRQADATPPTPSETAAGALERFELPEATRRLIADRLWPGATLIVSDRGLSGETGTYTDFIVVTR